MWEHFCCPTQCKHEGTLQHKEGFLSDCTVSYTQCKKIILTRQLIWVYRRMYLFTLETWHGQRAIIDSAKFDNIYSIKCIIATDSGGWCWHHKGKALKRQESAALSPSPGSLPPTRPPHLLMTMRPLKCRRRSLDKLVQLACSYSAAWCVLENYPCSFS